MNKMTAWALSTTPLAPRTPGCPVPLTSGQLRAWHNVVNRGAQRSWARYCAASLRLLGPLDIRRLQNAIEAIVHRHESLRTRIAGPPDEPLQLVDNPAAFELPVLDFSKSHSDQREDFVRKAAEEFISEKIDLAIGPLFAARVFKFSRQDHVLVIGADHIISDAVSFSILTREILTLYDASIKSETYSLPQLSVQFPDFAVWQAGTQEAWVRHHAAYWQSRLVSAEKTLLPVDRERPSSDYPDRQFLHIPFGKAVSVALADTARRYGTLMPLVVLSIQLVIMFEWCQKSTLLVEFFSHGRKGFPALKNMIGFLAHPMYFLVQAVPTETFKDLVCRVTEQFYSALEHDASRVAGNLVATGIHTEVHFNWVQTYSTPQWSPLGPERDLRVRPFPVTKSLPALFEPHYYPTASGIVAEIWYGRGLFEKSTLKWLENGLRSIARDVGQNPDVHIRTLQSVCAR